MGESVIKVDKDREGHVSRYMVRESMKREVERGILKGMHLKDASEVAGLPYELALAQVGNDPEFREWMELSENRTQILKTGDPTMRGVRRKTGLQIKQDFVNKLNNAGLFDKITKMAESADPDTEAGQQVLAFFMKTIIKDVLPRETAAKVETVHNEDITRLSDADLLSLLEERREQRLALQAEVESGSMQRLKHGGRLLEYDDGADE